MAAAMAHLASPELSVVLADADVDAANLELALAPERLEERQFMGGQVAVIDPELCSLCGRCYEVCRFDAIIPGYETYRVDPLACEGCASCVYQCPEPAIHSEEQQAGLWFRSDTRFGSLFHAHLLAGQENSGKLVTLVKQNGRLLAQVWARVKEMLEERFRRQGVMYGTEGSYEIENASEALGRANEARDAALRSLGSLATKGKGK